MRLHPMMLGLALGFLSLAIHPATAQEQATTSTSKPFVMAGSGVNLGITKLLAQAFMAKNPNVKIDVPGSIGTKGAITASKDGAITVGLTSRALKEEEKSPDVTEKAYAKTAMVVGVHPSVEETGLSYNELVSIYAAQKDKWKNQKDIIVLMREEYDSGFGILEKGIPGFKEACAESRKKLRWTTHFTDQEANKALAATPYAIGVTDLGMIFTEALTVKPLSLNSVMPSVDTLQNGQYPLTRTLYFLYRHKDVPADIKAFFDFVASEEGATILKANGYMPLMTASGA